MKNKTILGVLLLLLASATAFARDYNLDEQADISLASVNEVVFDLNGISCSLCIRSIDVMSEISGNGRSGDMELQLEGNISSNRDKAVPSLYVDENGQRITVRLYPERRSFFGLSQNGKATFSAVLPESFSGRVSVMGTSGDILIRDFGLESLMVESSSGDVELREIGAEEIDLEVSSGDLRGDKLAADRLLTVESSSGRLALGELSADNMRIEASSGDITIGSLEARTALIMKASSGRIGIGEVSAGSAEFRASSGNIDLETVSTDSLKMDLSSGDANLGRVQTRSFNVELSSGDLEIDNLDASASDVKTSGDTRIRSASGVFHLAGSSGFVELGLETADDEVSIDVSSGDIRLTLPADSRFDVELETSSGRIRSDFPVMGNLSSDNEGMKGSVNGGGSLMKAETSSGDIELQVR